VQIGQHRELLRLRVRRLERGLLVALGLLGASYFYLQVVRGAHYLELAENNRLRRTALEAPRGTITDRSGRVLVENLPSYALEVDPGATRDVPASLRFAAGILGRPVAELEELLTRERRKSGPGPVLLAENLALPQVARFRIARLEHPEFGIEVRQRRFYRLGPQGAHVLGYLGEVSASELAARPADLRAGEWIGRRGIERAYDDRLRGQDGERVMVVDHRGVPIREYGRVLGRPGAGLRLTLDADLQQEAERLLEGQVGAIVALDPRDGAIRAMVSAPAYDPNLFARRLAGDDWKALVEDERKPLQNRALQSLYSPGSVFKAVMATAALAEGVVTPSTRVYCPGFATHFGRRFHCWKRGGHGNVDLEEAIMHSCDVYFYEVGERLGIERIAKWARRFGLGEPTGVDVAGERSGLVPDDAWSQKARGHRWYPGETISVAIGQSALLTTPIQMARMFAAFANGGNLVEPHLVDGGGAPPRPVEALPAGVLAPVRSGLWRVVNEDGGTARGARVPGLEVAGKTGTVQVVSQEAYSDSSKELPWKLRNHAWFAAYAPAERPQLVVVVFVEHGGKGSAAAAPIARTLYESFFRTHREAVAAAS